MWASGCGLEFQTPNPSARIIALGDSATRGPGGQGYPEMMPGQLSVPVQSVVNEGVGGEETTAGLGRLKHLIDRKLFPNAETILIWEGGTDLIHFVAASDGSLQWNPLDENFPLREQLSNVLNRIESNLGDMIRAARDTNWTPYLLTYFPMRTDRTCLLFSFELSDQQANAIDAYFNSLNERIRSAAATNGVTVIDIAAIGNEIEENEANYLDCNHLSGQGNTLVAAQVTRVLGAQVSSE